MKVALKELRETQINLKILHQTKLATNTEIMKECSELVAIFSKSIQTAKKNGEEKNLKPQNVKSKM